MKEKAQAAAINYCDRFIKKAVAQKATAFFLLFLLCGFFQPTLKVRQSIKGF
jgi:hypothetical protein